MHKLQEIVMLLFGVPFFAATITIGRLLGRWCCWLPTDLEELQRKPDILLKALRLGGRLPCVTDASVAVAFVATGASDTEPGKAISVVKGVLTFRPDGRHPAVQSIKVFAKVSSNRKVSIWLKALGSCFLEEHKEVGVMNRMLPWLRAVRQTRGAPAARPADTWKEECLESGVGIQVAKPYFAVWNRWIDRSFIVYAQLSESLVPTPDWKGVSVTLLLKQLAEVRVLHAASWGISGAPGSAARWRGLDFIKERRGAEWLSGLMKLFDGLLSPAKRAVWRGLCGALEGEVMCASHGDCRPGNMLWALQPDDAAASVVITDWECICISPFMWDCSYAMVCGLPTRVRRDNEDAVVDACLEGLAAAVQANHYESDAVRVPVPPKSVALRQVRLLYLMVYYFGWLLFYMGGIGDVQGHTKEDVREWKGRVHDAIKDAVNTPGMEEWLQVDSAVLQQFVAEVVAE